MTACSSFRQVGPVEHYEGFLIHLTEGFVFYPCDGHTKLGWRVANDVILLPELKSLPGQTLGIGNLVYLACTGVRREVAKPAAKLPVWPYEIHIREVVEIRPSRRGDCHPKRLTNR